MVDYTIIGHALQLAGIFLAFIAAGISFLFALQIKGGAMGKAAILSAIGFVVLAFDILMTYLGAITGQLDMIHITLFWPLLGFITLAGFGIIAYAQYKMYRVVK
ncbi:MAG TPA: hypothetical protein VJI46_03640 [Candidatus Nanoarchaeia archaeon]|nr:hypothetical protein [Candidatus Nanoarchaeia archaeon]